MQQSDEQAQALQGAVLALHATPQHAHPEVRVGPPHLHHPCGVQCAFSHNDEVCDRKLRVKCPRGSFSSLTGHWTQASPVGASVQEAHLNIGMQAQEGCGQLPDLGEAAGLAQGAAAQEPVNMEQRYMDAGEQGYADQQAPPLAVHRV